MNKLFTLIVISQCLFFEYPSDSAELFQVPEERYIRLEYGKQLKNKDGSVVQVLWINGSSKHFYSLFRHSEFKAICRVDKKNCYSLPVLSHDNRALIKIKAGKASFFEVRIFTVMKNAVYTAETSFSLFGQSNKPPEREGLTDQPEDFPAVSILSPLNNYWPQTGRVYRFKLNSGRDTGNYPEIKAVDKGIVLSLEPDSNGEFTCIPPHDRDLDTRGAAAYKNSFIQIKEKRGGRIFRRTYTLLLHRSRDAYHDLKSGLFLVSGSMAFFLFLVIRARGKKNRQRV